ncbi:SRPBCC domain-containing protein [Halieaceae bacterium IMCC14734]|uniref:SRPBCC domain-containing protein n=1 Tax=Candidatus Litorirhabdus singularis TaxID=2518993 RepID=A0ABT3TKL3_9GAMM|nr:SRPBCC domain-containing protein [Candidatus Litorirhabdus singularis]MCX2982549.1 SRPBCC domain-containing protein [Candidatus Litorirhabdus singularis]
MISDTAVSSSPIIIQAPVERVWEVLVDFPNYINWNRFNPDIQTQLSLETPVVMQVVMAGQQFEMTEYMSRIEPCRALAWRMENNPGDPIHAERTQYLEALDANSCKYWSVDEFSGVGMAAMLAESGPAVEAGFELAADCLKQHCEALVGATTSN